jgi:hypothetical protein
MNDELRQRLEKLTKPEQEQRLKELAERLGIARPKILGGEDPKPLNIPEYREYVELKRILGFD